MGSAISSTCCKEREALLADDLGVGDYPQQPRRRVPAECPLIGCEPHDGGVRAVIFRTLLVGLCAAVALLVPDVAVLMGLFGSSAGGMVTLVSPSLIRLALNRVGSAPGAGEPLVPAEAEVRKLPRLWIDRTLCVFCTAMCAWGTTTMAVEAWRGLQRGVGVDDDGLPWR